MTEAELLELLLLNQDREWEHQSNDCFIIVIDLMQFIVDYAEFNICMDMYNAFFFTKHHIGSY